MNEAELELSKEAHNCLREQFLANPNKDSLAAICSGGLLAILTALISTGLSPENVKEWFNSMTDDAFETFKKEKDQWKSA